MEKHSFLDKIVFYGLLITILFCSTQIGSQYPFYQSLLSFTICLFASLRFLDAIIKKDFRLAGTKLFLPLGGVLVLALGQVTRFPGQETSLSADRYETRAFIVIFAAFMLTGEMLLHYTDTRRRLAILAGTVIGVGCSSAIFGLISDVYIGAPQEVIAEQGFAQFANRNHFAFMMEMTLGLLLGLLLSRKNTSIAKLFGASAGAILVCAIILANSRGGIASMIGICVTAILAYVFRTRGDANGRRRIRSPRANPMKRIVYAFGLSALALASIIFLIAFVGGDTVVTRIERIRDEVTTSDTARVNRKNIWRSTVNLIEDEPIFGSGFGAFGSAITKYDIADGSFSLQQAHNDYLEVLASGGITAGLLFIAFGVLLGSRIVKNMQVADELGRSAAIGAAIGIIGVLIHSFVDFGLHIPANAMIFIVLIVIGCSSISDNSLAGGEGHR